MQTKDRLYEFIGWIGFTLIISAYLLLTIKWYDSDSFVFHFINLFGAICMLFNAYHVKSKPIFSLNAVWCFIAIIGIARGFMA